MPTSIHWCHRTPRRWLTPPKDRDSWWTRAIASRYVHARLRRFRLRAESSLWFGPFQNPVFSIYFSLILKCSNHSMFKLVLPFSFLVFLFLLLWLLTQISLVLCVHYCLVSPDPVWLGVCNVNQAPQLTVKSKTHSGNGFMNPLQCFHSNIYFCPPVLIKSLLCPDSLLRRLKSFVPSLFFRWSQN